MPAKKKVQQEEPLQVVCKYHKTRQLYKALESKAHAQRNEALANLTVYFESAVGVGEHPNVVHEMWGQLDKLDDAESRLQALEKWFSEHNQ